MTLPPEALAGQAADYLLTLPGPRSLIALAGPPGAGKSTVGALIADHLRASGNRAAIVPMDGFHLDNRLLDERGLRARKGAPQTFDADGFLHLVSRIAQHGSDVVYPLFDRHRDISIAGAAILRADVEFVIFEGNYLLLKDPPWSRLAQYWTCSIWIDAPLEDLRARLVERWLSAGLSREQANHKVDENDLPNTRLVQSRSAPGDLSLSADG